MGHMGPGVCSGQICGQGRWQEARKGRGWARGQCGLGPCCSPASQTSAVCGCPCPCPTVRGHRWGAFLWRRKRLPPARCFASQAPVVRLGRVIMPNLPQKDALCSILSSSVRCADILRGSGISLEEGWDALRAGS